MTNSFPAKRVMTGKVVSILVAPPLEMGASFPKYLTIKGAHNKVMISLIMFEVRAIVPNSAPLY